ncbi:MAG: hypothetical protein ABJD07_13040 [Gemmatimonadaceae bacterium]
MSSETRKFLFSSVGKLLAATIAALALALVVAALAAQGAASTSTSGNAKDAAVSFRVSTLGFGLEVGKTLHEHASARIGVNYFGKNFTQLESDVTYRGNLRLQSVSFIGDYYPGLTNPFHLSVGVLANNTRIQAHGVAEKDGYFTINGHRYTNAQVGDLFGDATFPNAAAYLGMGWGRPVYLRSHWQLLADLGVTFSKPTLRLTASQSGVTPGLAADLAQEQADSQHDINKWLSAFPVISFGLSYRF